MLAGIVISAGLILMTGIIILAMCRQEISEWRAERRHRNETQEHHPGLVCFRCGAWNTQLVRDYLAGEWYCKDTQVCQRIRHMQEQI